MTDFPIHSILDEVIALKNKIVANIMSTKQNASGSTIQSLTIESTDNSVTLYGRSFFGVLETGRKPGKMPPISSILFWIKAKPVPVPPKMKDASFAFVIAKKIGREGTVNYQRGGRPDVYSNEIPLTIDNINKKLFGIFETEIDTIKLN